MADMNYAPPLLVAIQNVDISCLDFQGRFATPGGGDGNSGGTTSSKARHVTFIEATTFFIYVGSTSGTVYLFSRESLDFLLMIPFMGGKVCNISACSDESEVAVASIRGRVSIYQMSPKIHYLLQSQNNRTRSSASPGDVFKHLYDVPHHVNNEVTEMRWSTNGKFLFVGDNQGVISQTDVASLDEFPRPPPSRVILKLKFRILQIDCSFPFLAISTLTATFLCDFEKEDFTRIQTTQRQVGGGETFKKDIKSAGLCIVSQEGKEMFLLIGEVGTGRIFRCGMDGGVICSQKVELSPGMCNPVGCFDPKNVENGSGRTSCNNFYGTDLNYSPGKMFPTEDGQFVISVTSNRIFVCDVRTCKIVLWNEDFNRINSFRMIANYGFLWYGSKLGVFALTPFTSYGKQLFKAGLKSVLENWISYAVYSVGYNDEGENGEIDGNPIAIKMFREMMAPIDEEEEFSDFVGSYIPFKLIDPEVKRKQLQEESYDKKLKRVTKTLVDSVQFGLGTQPNVQSDKLKVILNALKEFYTDLCNSNSSLVPLLSICTDKDDNLNLLKVVSAMHIFVRQPHLINLKQDLSKHLLEESMINGVCGPILKCVLGSKWKSIELETGSDHHHCIFLRYAKCPLVQKYFKDLGISEDEIWQDALIADIIVLLLPLTSDKVLYDCCCSMPHFEVRLSKMFFTWITIMTFFGDKTHSLPFSGLLRTIQNPQYFDKLAEEMISSVYREVIFPRGDETCVRIQAVNYFPHFVTFAILYSKAPEIVKARSMSALILNLFPLKRGVNEDLVQKIVQLSRLNPILLQMYYKACLADGKSFKLCGCGIQAGYGLSLEGMSVPPFQRGIEEGVLHVLVEQYFEKQEGQGVNGEYKWSKTPVHLFAMKRCLILPYFKSSVCDDFLPDSVKILMLLRSGLCEGLQHIRFNLENLKLIRQTLTQRREDNACSSCGKEVFSGGGGANSTTTISMLSFDCVGVWILDNCGSLDRFMQIVKKLSLNSRGEFSLRFYQLVLKREELLSKNKGRTREDAGFGELVSISNLKCSLLHYK